VTAPHPSVQDARQARRRRLQQRQTVIFGGLVTILLVLALIAAAMFTGLVPSPLQREFSSPEPTDDVVVPCPPQDATALDLGSITANVYNGTDRAGLAGETGESLSRAGVLVNQEPANWPQGSYEGTAQIVVGAEGVVAGYSLARLFPGSVVSLDDGREDETVDVVLGAEYDSMLSQDEIDQLEPDEPLQAPEDCEPVRSAGGGENGDGESG